jgi:glutamyl-tRNA reductase
MQVICVGVSHKTSPVELREQLALDDGQCVHIASGFLRDDSIGEAVALSTCNRTELYLYAEDVSAARSAALARLAGCATTGADELEPYTYCHTGPAAIAHLFRVAASLDSMVVGEAQILAQIKTAHQIAGESGCASVVLNKVFRHAVEVGKRVRTETAIGQRPVSISSAAVELALQVFGKLENHVVLILGAGEMSELTATHLKAQGITKIFVTNRTLSAGQELAERYGGSAVEWDRLEEHLAIADIVISSTAAPLYVVHRAQVERAMHARRGKPLFIIDIAVPRDCEPEINKIDGAYLYDIDDLQEIVDRNRGAREREAEQAEAIVEEEVARVEAWLAGLEVVPTINLLRAEIEKIREAEYERIVRRMGDVDEDTLRKVRMLSTCLVNKILHEPTVRLKELAATDRDATIYIEALRHLFGLEEAEQEGVEAAAGSVSGDGVPAEESAGTEEPLEAEVVGETVSDGGGDEPIGAPAATGDPDGDPVAAEDAEAVEDAGDELAGSPASRGRSQGAA